MTSFNHTNSTRERFRQHQANKDAERAAMAERERSEEHTSELQSRLHLVCRLLLEKKKQTHNVNRCGRSRHLARKLSLRRQRSSPTVFEMAATETITSSILIKLIRVSHGTVRHPRRFKIVVIDIQITLKQMLRDFIGISFNRANFFFLMNRPPRISTLFPTATLSR